jgi:hypothetical protein
VKFSLEFGINASENKLAEAAELKMYKVETSGFYDGL